MQNFFLGIELISFNISLAPMKQFNLFPVARGIVAIIHSTKSGRYTHVGDVGGALLGGMIPQENFYFQRGFLEFYCCLYIHRSIATKVDSTYLGY